jgi:hypothetical protein
MATIAESDGKPGAQHAAASRPRKCVQQMKDQHPGQKGRELVGERLEGEFFDQLAIELRKQPAKMDEGGHEQ